jgi:beta-galactosidase
MKNTIRMAMLLALLLSAVFLSAQAPKPPAVMLGTAWYPEQWPEARWDADLALMEKAGVRCVRVAEFSWTRLEPTEGNYDFGWLERAVEAAARHHIYTVIGTPTATPPAWMTQKYPEVLRTMEDGRKDQHGNRQQFNWANAKYREFARDIAGRLGEHFGHNSWVVGWQIDNEYATNSYDAETKRAFQDWLHARYGTIDNLNARWTTQYWSEAYTDWNQIPIQTNYGNPGLLLNWKRFVSETWRSYQKNQIDAIRAHAEARQFITTNFMGWFDGFDHYTVSQDLDMTSWDHYIGQGHFDAAYNGSTHDLTRGFKNRNFWIMETQPGHVNWARTNNEQNKGEARAMAWFAVGHGADHIGYWQWRSALNGQEEYHGTLVGADGEPVPFYYEAAQVGAEFAKASPALEGTTPRSAVAILNSYDGRWAVDWQRHSGDFDPVGSLISYYKPLRQIAQSVDIEPGTADLGKYKVVVAPATMNVLSDAAAKNLIAYVENGGHLVLGQRFGMKDDDNGLQPARQPGPLVNLLGAKVEQYYALTEAVPVSGSFGEGSSRLWAEFLTVKEKDVEVLARYGKSNGWLDGQPAVVTRKVGKGRITYVGTWFDEASQNKLAEWIAKISGVTAAFGPVPQGVEVMPRYGESSTVFVLTNFSKSEQKIELPHAMNDVLNGGKAKSVTLPVYGVAVLEEKK